MKPMLKGNRFYKSRDHLVMEVKSNKGDLLECLIDVEDVLKVMSHPNTWRATVYPNGWTYISSTTYVEGSRKTVLLHRYLTDCPNHLVVDHLNHNTLDNRRLNLRVCTQSENMQNMGAKKGTKSGFKGVSWDSAYGGRWRVGRTVKGKRYDKGYFKNLDEAIEVARKLNEELGG